MLRKFLFILLLLGCCSNAYAAKKILVLGDSLSASYGIEVQRGWVDLLQQRLQNLRQNYQVINASISGDTTSNGLARLPDALAKHKPDLVIIELGGNDGLRGLKLATIKNNLAKIIQLAKKSGRQVLLVGVRLPPNYGPVYTKNFQALYVDLAKRYKVSVVPLLLNNVDENAELLQADGIHPQAAAQQQMLENVWLVLKHML